MSDVPRDHLMVFFVRHPISRFVSGFYSRLRRGLPRHHYEWNEAEQRAFHHFQKANDLAEGLSSTDSTVATRAGEAMRGISHVKNTYKDWFSGVQELDDRLDSILLLGIQEQLDADFGRLKMLLNLPTTLSLPEDDALAHRTPQQFDRSLSPLSVRNLSEWYAEDIRFYEHCLRVRTTQIHSCQTAPNRMG